MAEPMPSPTDARQVRTRKNLLDALLRLLETRPFDQVTIREIAAEAGIGYATFFRHHPSKEALLHELAAGQISELLARTLPMFAAHDTRQSCAALFRYVADRRALWTALLTGGAAATLKQEFIDQARRIADEQGSGDGLIPDELRVVVSVSATVEILAWWLQQDLAPEVARMAEILDRLVVGPAIAGSDYAR
jgi:AcrR family transcriptional regulator